MLRSLLSAILLGASSVSAITLPLTRRAPPHSTSVHLSPARKSQNASSDDPFNFQVQNDGLYLVTIQIAGSEFTVSVDTGSADLWVDSSIIPIPNFTNTSIEGSIGYLDGSGANGSILLANVTLGDFSVPQQALINAVGQGSADVQGLLGVGLPDVSSVRNTLENSKFNGLTFLENVFALYPDEPNFTTFLLARNEVGTVDGGLFTIGEIDPDHQGILNEPQLPPQSADGWNVLADGLFVNDQLFTGNSLGFPNVPDDKLLASFDTGTSLGAAPPAYVRAMYANLPGATFDGTSRWNVPCDTKLNVSFVFNSQEYPIHPLDLTFINDVDDNGTVSCLGTYSESHQDTGTDFLLGDYFLRNVYVLYDYGKSAEVGQTDPFVKILNVTNVAQAWAEFDAMNEARIQQFLSVFGPNASSDSADSSEKEAVRLSGSSANNASSTVDLSGLVRNSYIIIGLAGAAVLLLLILLISSCTGGFPGKLKGNNGSKARGFYKPYRESQSSVYSAPYGDMGSDPLLKA